MTNLGSVVVYHVSFCCYFGILGLGVSYPCFSLFWPESQLTSDWLAVKPTHQDVCLDIMNLQTHLELHFGEVNLTK